MDLDEYVLARELEKKMLTLPESEMKVIFLLLYMDLNIVDVAEILETTPRIVKSKFVRGVSRLKQDFKNLNF